MKIKKGDIVLIQTGKDKGKSGKVSKAIPAKKQIIVAGLNVLKKHSKASRKNPGGGIIDLHAPINVSNVMIVCPRCNKFTRVSYKTTEKNKLRVCKKCHESLDQ